MNVGIIQGKSVPIVYTCLLCIWRPHCVQLALYFIMISDITQGTRIFVRNHLLLYCKQEAGYMGIVTNT